MTLAERECIQGKGRRVVLVVQGPLHLAFMVGVEAGRRAHLREAEMVEFVVSKKMYEVAFPTKGVGGSL